MFRILSEHEHIGYRYNGEYVAYFCIIIHPLLGI